MGIARLAVFGALAAAVYKFWPRGKSGSDDESGEGAAFASDQGAPGNVAQVRDAGPDAMRDPTVRPWTKTDQEIDESFPASDPPGNY